MVSTIDGKTIFGERDESVVGLGSSADQEVMDRLERRADAILLGAGSIRANPLSWNPHCETRVAVSESGNMPWESKFFTGGRAYVASSMKARYALPLGVGRLAFGRETLDWRELLAHLRKDLKVQNLHVLGGSELNAQLLREDLLDELFLTVAPKVKLGRDLPTYAGGEPLSKQDVKQFELVESHVVADEVFLRYRRRT